MVKKPMTFTTARTTYITHRQIGEGASGVVYEARDEESAPFALKLYKGTGGSSTALKRFHNELEFCRRCDNRHIVRVLDSGFHEEGAIRYPFYVMPVYPKTLASLMADGVPPEHAFQLSVLLLDAVEASHLLGTVHRDLKPSNILTDAAASTLVLADFGAAYIAPAMRAAEVITKASDRLANAKYAAPEQRDGSPGNDARTDLYAVGLIIHELFTGEVIQGKGHKTIAAIAPDFAYLDGIIDQLVQQDIGNRPASVDELRTRLLALGKQAGDRQKLDAQRNIVIRASVSTDPLVLSPPRLQDVDVDAAGRTLHLILDKPVSNDWIESFRHLNVAHTVGLGPGNFVFANDRASIRLVHTNFSQAHIQSAVDAFKAFLAGAVQSFQQRREREILEKEQAARNDLRARIEAEEQRQRILTNIKI